jgi:predicted nucleic acid-binding protein
MAIDPSSFNTSNVVDTCAVWNVLSSRRLYNAALLARCHFVITAFVQYECLHKQRTAAKQSEVELRSRLRAEQSNGRFTPYSCDLEDLQTVALLQNRKRLGKGEISSIAFAIKYQQAVLTDDQKARRLASQAGHKLVQTTPHLFGWLVFTGRLGDQDKDVVIAEHRKLDGILSKHLEEAYRVAPQYRLAAPPAS